MDLLLCADANPNLFGFFDLTIAPTLLYYAYIPIVLISLLLSGFVMFQDKYSTRSVSLFSLCVVFSLFLLNEIILWTAIPAGFVVFSWSLILLLRFLFLVTLVFFSYAFIFNRPLPFKYLASISALALPILFLLPTQLTVRKFNLPYCEGISGYLWQYQYVIEALTLIFFLAWSFTLLFSFFKTRDTRMLQGTQLTGSISLLLILFSATEIYGEATGYYEITLIGPLGMLMFVATLAYLIVHYHAFNIKLAGAQALVIGLMALVGALLFVVKSPTSQAVAAATFFFTAIAGYFLVRSVKKEIKQREQLEVLTQKLAVANDRLKELDKLKSEFVSIASHQMRSPLTSMRGYASMVLDGSYGSIPDKAKEAIQRIADSSAFMAKMIENYLNVSRIESGNMKYELSDFNLKLETEKVVDDKRQEAIKKGLLLTFKSNLRGQGIVHADIGKTLEIVHNLLNNALKYTPKGSIDVLVHDDPKKKKIYVDIKDSGIGMNPEDVTKLFGKFERAQNANSVNITGTGLGLYVARTMANAMGGEITAMSEGQGKGSTFRFELTEVM